MEQVSIIFNGKQRVVDAREYSYSDLIYMCYSDLLVKPMSYPDIMTITYDKGPKDNKEGSLKKGDTISFVEGMIINAMRTDNS
jgi:hypothetical protein